MDAKKKSDEPGDDTDVFTQKHSENLFQRTEVLAGEALAAKVYLTRNKTENRVVGSSWFDENKLGILGKYWIVKSIANSFDAQKLNAAGWSFHSSEKELEFDWCL